MNKIRLILIILIVLITTNSIAIQPVRIVWDASETIGVEGYKIHYSNGSSSWVVDVSNVLEYSVPSIPLSYGVRYSFYVTAYIGSNESGPSNTIHFTWPNYHVGIF